MDKKYYFPAELAGPCRLTTKTGNILYSIPVVGKKNRLYIFTDIFGNYIPAQKEREEGKEIECYEWWHLLKKTKMKPKMLMPQDVAHLKDVFAERTKYLALPLEKRRIIAGEIYSQLS